jgi:hypothetical protein
MDHLSPQFKTANPNVEKRSFGPALLEEVDVPVPKVMLTPRRTAHQQRG